MVNDPAGGGFDVIRGGPPVPEDRQAYLQSLDYGRDLDALFESLSHPEQLISPARLQTLAYIGYKGVEEIERQSLDNKRRLAEFVIGDSGLVSLLDLDKDTLPSFVNAYTRYKSVNSSPTVYHHPSGEATIHKFNDEIKRVIKSAEFVPEDIEAYQDLVTTLIAGYDEVVNKLDEEVDREGYRGLIIDIMQSGFDHFGEREEYIDFYFRKAKELSDFNKSGRNSLLAFIPDTTELEIIERIGFQTILRKQSPEDAAYFSDKWFEEVEQMPKEDQAKIVESWLSTGNPTSFPLRPGHHLKLLRLFQESLSSGHIETKRLVSSGYSSGGLRDEHIVDLNKFLYEIADFSAQETVFQEDGSFDDKALDRLVTAAEAKFEINNKIIGSIDDMVDAPDDVVREMVNNRLDEDEIFQRLTEDALYEYQKWEDELTPIAEEQSFEITPPYQSRKFTVNGKSVHYPSSYLSEVFHSFLSNNRVEGSGNRSGWIGISEVKAVIDLCDYMNHSKLSDTDIQDLIDFIETTDSPVRQFLGEYNYLSEAGQKLIPVFYKPEEYTNLLSNPEKGQIIERLEQLVPFFDQIAGINDRESIKKFVKGPKTQLETLLNFLKGNVSDPNEINRSSIYHSLDNFVGILAGMYRIPRFRETLGTFVHPSDGEYEITEGRVISANPRENCLPNHQIGGLLNIGFDKGTSVVIGGPTGSGKTFALNIVFESLFPGSRAIPNAKVIRPFNRIFNSSDGVYRVGFDVPNPNESLADQSIKELAKVAKADVLCADELISGGTDLAAAVLEYIQLMKRKKSGLTTVVTTHHSEELGVLDTALNVSGLKHYNIIPISHEVRDGMSSSFGPETFQRIGTEEAIDMARMIEELKQQIIFRSDEIIPPDQEFEYEQNDKVFDPHTIDELQLLDTYKILIDSISGGRFESEEIAKAFTEYLKIHSVDGPEFFERNIHTNIERYLEEGSSLLKERMVQYALRTKGLEIVNRAKAGIGRMDYTDRYNLYSFLLGLSQPRSDVFLNVSQEEQELAGKLKDYGLQHQEFIKTEPDNVIELSRILSKEIQYQGGMSRQHPAVAKMLYDENNMTFDEAEMRQLHSECTSLLKQLFEQEKNGNRGRDEESVESKYSEFLNPTILDLSGHFGDEALSELLHLAGERDHLDAIGLSSLYTLMIKNGFKGKNIFTQPKYGEVGNVPMKYDAAYNLHLLDSLSGAYVPIHTPEFSGDDVVAQVKIGNQKAGKSASLITEAGIVAHTIISGYCPAENVRFKQKPKAIAARIIRSIGGDNYSQYETEARKLLGIYKTMSSNPDTWVFIDEASNGVDSSTKKAVISLFLAMAVENNTPIYLTTLLDETNTFKKLPGSEKIAYVGYDRKKGKYQGKEGVVEPDTLELAREADLLDSNDYYLAKKLYSLLLKYYS